MRVIGVTSLTVVSLVVGAKQLGWLQPLELKAFDRIVRLREDQPADDRLLIVGITESDIQAMARSTPDDATLAKALRNLEQYEPRVIGLDLHRDVPQEPGNAELQQQLKSPHLIAITKLGERADAVPPPPHVPEERIGFNDLPVDEDGIVRRNLLFASTEDTTFFSFALRLALSYLEPEGITPAPSATDSNVMQIGSVEFHPLGKSSGAYEQLDDRGYQVLLKYRRRWDVARTVTLTQVVRNEVPASWIRNKVVMIGTTAPSAKDLFYTPYSAGEQEDHQMAGVVIHAQMVSQIISTVLDGEPLFQFWSDPQEWLWILAWSLLAGSLAWMVRHPVALGLSASGLIVLLVGSCVLQFQQDRWVPTVAPAIAALLSAGLVVTNRAQQAHQQQKMVMTLLGQNTSPEIANALWQSRDRLLESGKLPGKRLVATMLFTDIRGFSHISEQMAPEALLEWLNEYLEAMTEEIQRHQGIINKFTGDGLLAVFGVPMPRLEEREVDEDAYRAVSCALAMAKRLRLLNKGWEERGFSAVEMRVGIFTGPVVVGSLGGRDRMEYGVIGDSVNIASRLESCAKERQVDPCRILIAEETLVHIKEHFEVESWGPMSLHGKQQQINIYRVLGYALLPPPPIDVIPVPEEGRSTSV
ncbi:adenylate/guanylate cyclase domain-containing protein [Leptolyngbya sp. FACHB-16]|nr:adenylate/guanylate cyclase domain-containing protein [Leptolyngbya sp. FACHB-8]MBD2155841.1 adenylate/guanylate cyclase domain-containing protein [Leptolyngbya sp. FACHB-16]